MAQLGYPGVGLGLEVGSELGEAGWEVVALEADAFDGASQCRGLGGCEGQLGLLADCAFDERCCVASFGACGKPVEFDHEHVRLIATEVSTIQAVWLRWHQLLLHTDRLSVALKPVQKSGRGHQSIEWCDPNECLRLFIPERVMTACGSRPMSREEGRKPQTTP